MVTTNGPTTTAARTEAAPDLTFQPTVDICDRGAEVLLVCDVPGARPDGIDVTFEDGVLAVQAAVPPRELPGSALRREYGVGNYRRSFRLGEGFDASLITADDRRGVLTIRVPRLAAVRPRKVAVRTA
jgi:HSP20 family molecular chaperone IbpA